MRHRGSNFAPPAPAMLRPESPLADHRSLLPRRLLPVKAQIVPADKRKNRRSLELATPDHATYDYPKLLISKTTDSLNSECPRKVVCKQDSNDSLKRVLIPKQDDKRAHLVKECDPKRGSIKLECNEFKKDIINLKQESNESVKKLKENDVKKVIVRQESIESIKRTPELRRSPILDGVRRGSDKKGSLETSDPLENEGYKRICERWPGCGRPALPPVAERTSVGGPKSPGSGPRTPGVAAVAGGVVRWGSGLLSPKDEPRLKTARSWYGYGTLPTDPDKVK